MPASGASAVDQVEALLADIAPVIATARQTPDVEVITSTTAPESATGALEREVARLWRRQRIPFTGAVRRAAAGDRAGVRVVQSGQTSTGTEFGQRWALSLLVANYRTLPDLPEVRQLLRRGSPYGEAIAAEFGRVTPVLDPTGAQIQESIVSSIVELATTLRPGEIGQLLVTFSGHGRAGIIAGVDGVPTGLVRPEWLMERARFAADLGVQVMYVFDTCHAGRLVQLAQRLAAERHAPAAGTMPATRQAAVQPLLSYRSDLLDVTEQMSDRTNDVIQAQRALEHRRRPAGSVPASGIGLTDELRLGVIEAVQQLASANDRLRAILGRRPPLAPANEPLVQAVNRLQWFLLAALSGRSGDIEAAFRHEAIVLDHAADYLSQLLDAIRRESAGTEAREAA